MATSDQVCSCSGLSAGYGEEPVLRDVTLSVRRGEIVTILGGSGSGKSTLLRTLAGLLEPLAGSVRLLGQDPYALDRERRRDLNRRVGVLYQSDALFGSMSVFDNVALPLQELTNLPRSVIERLVRARLALVDVLSVERSFPDRISGGQSKRAALARATILDPWVLLCDEPTSALDPVAGAQVDRLLLRLRAALGMAIVAVTHDVESVRTIADRAVVVGDGRVRAIATVPELELSADPEIRAFFGRGRSRSPTFGEGTWQHEARHSSSASS